MKFFGLKFCGDGGFTLLEVVLAFTIFALLSAILYGAFSVGHRAMEKSQTSFEANQQFRSSIDVLASYIRSTYPYRASSQNQNVWYAGEENQVEFVSAFSLAQGGRGMARIRIAAEGDGAEQLIRLEEQVPVRVTEENQAAIRNSLVLREKVRDFRLSYLNPEGPAEQWLDRWDQDERKGLPRALRLSYRNAAGEDVRWTFPLMMAVMAP